MWLHWHYSCSAQRLQSGCQRWQLYFAKKKATAFAMVVAAVCRKPRKTLAKLEDWGYNDVLLEISEKLKL